MMPSRVISVYGEPHKTKGLYVQSRIDITRAVSRLQELIEEIEKNKMAHLRKENLIRSQTEFDITEYVMINGICFMF